MRSSSTSNPARRVFGSYPFRLLGYALATLLLYELVYQGIRRLGPERMGNENGPIELSQLALAIFAAGVFFYSASRTVVGRSALIACGAVVAYAAARESDALLEQLFFDDAYKWLVGLPAIVLVAVAAYRERQRLVADWLAMFRHPAATLFVVAGTYLVAVCQVLDRPGMWGDAFAAGDLAATKVMVEEFMELFAYWLLAIAAIESVAWTIDAGIGYDQAAGGSAPGQSAASPSTRPAIDDIGSGNTVRTVGPDRYDPGAIRGSAAVR